MAQQAQNLIIEADECVSLTPDSERFKPALQQYRPQTIAEVRKLLGPSDVGADGKPAPACCLPPELTAHLPTPEALTAEDPQLRYRARAQAALAARAYVQAADTGDFRHFEATLDRYIQLSKPILISFLFADIDIGNGATLNLAQNAHILFAAHIRMHGTGRIVCKGPTTIRATSVNGFIPVIRPGNVTAVAAASALRNS